MDREKIEETIRLLREFNQNNSQPVVREATPYKAPSLSLLKDYPFHVKGCSMAPKVLESKLSEFGFKGEVVSVSTGPVITRYELRLAAGIRLSQIRNISDDLALALMSDRIRIQAPIPGTALVGIEVINEEPATIGLRNIMKSVRNDKKSKLPIAVGTDTVGNPKVLDLAKMPHLLIAGQTGSGKSVGLNVMILSLLYTKTPDEVKLIMVDPKRVEMTSYEGIPHLMRPVVTEPIDAIAVLNGLVTEMEKRYRILSDKRVRNIESYNSLKDVEHMPYIVAVVDEMADLMMTAPKELEKSIVRLAQLSRAVGIHLILATQKPVVKIVTGLIKSNMPSRIAFQVASKSDSRVILDGNGADKLLGRGDMLAIYPGISEPVRLHGAWVSDSEIENVTNFLRGE